MRLAARHIMGLAMELVSLVVGKRAGDLRGGWGRSGGEEMGIGFV